MLADNSAVGCGAYHCQILGDGSTRVSNVTLLVCNYLLVYVSPRQPFVEGEVCSSCPQDAPVCVQQSLCGEKLVHAPNKLANFVVIGSCYWSKGHALFSWLP